MIIVFLKYYTAGKHKNKDYKSNSEFSSIVLSFSAIYHERAATIKTM